MDDIQLRQDILDEYLKNLKNEKSKLKPNKSFGAFILHGE